MGFSCTKDAGDTYDQIGKCCVAQTGSNNTFQTKHGRYFLEKSRVDREDGGISGTIWKHVGKDYARNVGSFLIDGKGNVVRGPAILKAFGSGASFVALGEF